MTLAISTVEAYAATVNIASKLTSGRMRDGAGMSRNLRVSEASKHASVSVALCG
jgi:hypothetical protein